MKKCFLSLLLCAALLVVPAHAAENSMDNFVRTKEYTGNFSDLTADSTFYNNVVALYEYGLSVGKTDGTFGLQDELTVSQIVIFAGRIRSLYRTGDAEAGSTAYVTETPRPACMAYLDYLKAEGVLGDELDGVLFTSATRAQMAHVLSRVLPELPAINETVITEAYAAGVFVIDVTEETPYQQDILQLYRTGISHGSDEYGSFYPDAPITRGAAAAMLTRMADPELRIRLAWKTYEVPDVSDATMASLVEPADYVAAPETDEELDQAVRNMLSNNRDKMTLHFPGGKPLAEVRQLALSLLERVKTYCEQGYNSVATTFDGSNSITFHFSAPNANSSLKALREKTMEYAIAVHDDLWRSGFITADMTEMEKARIYYVWVCLNGAYDDNADDISLSHLPYSLFHTGLAVCDSYTGAYNLLLKLEGIDCSAVFTETHIWTVATLDGVEYHIDTTWGDDGDVANASFFAMTPERSLEVHGEYFP